MTAPTPREVLGFIEYDPENHWLIENDGDGASRIIARDVAYLHGRAIAAALTRREPLDVEDVGDVDRAEPIGSIDVERLALAWHAVEHGSDNLTDHDVSLWLRHARLIAAEYARLVAER